MYVPSKLKPTGVSDVHRARHRPVDRRIGRARQVVVGQVLGDAGRPAGARAANVEGARLHRLDHRLDRGRRRLRRMLSLLVKSSGGGDARFVTV